MLRRYQVLLVILLTLVRHKTGADTTDVAVDECGAASNRTFFVVSSYEILEPEVAALRLVFSSHPCVTLSPSNQDYHDRINHKLPWDRRTSLGVFINNGATGLMNFFSNFPLPSSNPTIASDTLTSSKAILIERDPFFSGNFLFVRNFVRVACAVWLGEGSRSSTRGS